MKYEQINLFESIVPTYRITKPIRLIELFGGIGAQASSLERLGVKFEHHRMVELDKSAVKSYNAVHGTSFEPTDIRKVHAKDLGIVEREKYCYIMTYSFPCQDLSINNSKGKGLKGTRSGLLYEVERLINELGMDLPDVLLLENVPTLLFDKHLEDFRKWQNFLESKGYSNNCELLNAKDYGIPQNRERCIMVSILGDWFYKFPPKQELKTSLKDLEDEEVDPKYFLDREVLRVDDLPRNSELRIKSGTKRGYEIAHEGDCIDLERPASKTRRGRVGEGIAQTLMARSTLGVVVLAKKKESKDVQCIGGFGNLGSTGQFRQQNRVYADDLALSVCTRLNPYYETELGIRRLTPREYWRLMGFTDADFDKASKVTAKSQLYKQAGNSIVVNMLMAVFKQML